MAFLQTPEQFCHKALQLWSNQTLGVWCHPVMVQGYISMISFEELKGTLNF